MSLIRFVKEGNTAAVNDMLTQGSVNVNEKDENRRTALMWASEKGHTEIVKLLIEKGVCVNDKNEQGETALTYAVSNNHAEIVKILIEVGADFFDERTSDQTILVWASKNGQVEVVKAILKTSNTKGESFLRRIVDNATNSQDLIDAATKGKVDTVSYLLQRGAPVNDKDRYGRTALMMAAICNQDKIVQLLIENGARVNDKDENDKTVLVHAVSYSCDDIVKILLKAGANFKEDAVSKEGLTQFFMRNLAIIYIPSFTNMIKYLILDCQSTLLQDNKESREQVQPHLKKLLDYIETQSLELFQITNKDAAASNKLVALKMLLSIVCEGVEKLGNNTKQKGYVDATLKNQAVISLINYRCNSGVGFFKGEVGGTGTRDKCDQKSLMEPVPEPEEHIETISAPQNKCN